MSEPKVKWIPITWEKEYVGFCADDLSATGTGIKEGKWVKIKYKGKAISAEVTEVTENENWMDHLIWIPRSQRTKLGLPEGVESNWKTKDSVPPKDKKLVLVELEFDQLNLPRNKVFWFTVAMAVIAVITLILKTLYDGEYLPEPYLSIVGVTALILLAISTVVNTLSAYLQQK